MELRKKAETIPVPTSDDLIIEKLRELEEPIILFAESKPERRWRLKMILARRGETHGNLLKEKVVSMPKEEHRPYTTNGTEALKNMRTFVLTDSISRSRERIADLKKPLSDEMAKNFESLKEAGIERISKLTPITSVVGDERPLSSITTSPCQNLVATCSWTGRCKLWDISSSKELLTYYGHEERVVSILFHPHSGKNLSKSSVNIASGSADNTIKFWNLESDKAIATLKGHTDRVNGIDFHPSGRILASTSHDTNWNLWDVESESLIISQEGHSKPSYGVKFHPDGALVATCGLDSHGRVWDIRSGKPIYSLKGHVKQVLSIDWHPHGSLVVTGSDDHTCSIWDLRMRRQIYTILAHDSVISSLKFTPGEGKFLLTSGYDSKIKIWDGETFHLVQEFSGHEQKVTRADFVFDESNSLCPKYIVSSSFDRTWKLWGSADEL